MLLSGGAVFTFNGSKIHLKQVTVLFFAVLMLNDPATSSARDVHPKKAAVLKKICDGCKLVMCDSDVCATLTKPTQIDVLQAKGTVRFLFRTFTELRAVTFEEPQTLYGYSVPARMPISITKDGVIPSPRFPTDLGASFPPDSIEIKHLSLTADNSIPSFVLTKESSYCYIRFPKGTEFSSDNFTQLKTPKEIQTEAPVQRPNGSGDLVKEGIYRIRANAWYKVYSPSDEGSCRLVETDPDSPDE